MPQANPSSPAPIRSAPPVRNAWPAQLSSALQRTGGRESRIHIFPPALQLRVRARAEKCCYHSPQSQPKEVTRNMSAINKTTIFKRTSLIVYEADIFNCSQQMHDFPDKILGKAVPYGILDIQQNDGYVNVGINHDTGEFSVASIERWWNALGKERYLHAQRLLITADAGGSNGWRLRLWKKELQRFADATGLSVTVSHFPPGTSKWNKIEHKLFSFISMNWRGKLLSSYKVIVNLIASTKTKSGLKVYAVLDDRIYALKKKVTEKEMRTLNLHPDSFHGEWNYTIQPQR